MTITAACDVCRHKYQVPETRLGERKTCKQCHSEFELDEFVGDVEQVEQGPTAWQQTWEWIGHGGSAVMVIAVVGVLVALLWIDPQERALAGNRSAGSRLPASSRSSADNSHRPPVVPQVPFKPTPATPTVRPNRTSPQPQGNNTSSSRDPALQSSFPNIQSHPSIAQNPFPKPTPSPAPAIPAITPPSVPNLDGLRKQQEEFRKRHEQMMEQHRKSVEQMRRPGFGRPPSFGSPFDTSGSSSSTSSGPKISDELDYSGPNPLRPSGKEVQFVRQLKKGQVVLAERGGFWYPAEVVGVQAGRVFVHYRGQSDNSWDGVVTRERLQLPHDDAEID